MKQKLTHFLIKYYKNNHGSGGIWTHASEETGAWNQRLRPLGHATLYVPICLLLTELP